MTGFCVFRANMDLSLRRKVMRTIERRRLVSSAASNRVEFARIPRRARYHVNWRDRSALSSGSGLAERRRQVRDPFGVRRTAVCVNLGTSE
jgi:hypothetical protein